MHRWTKSNERVRAGTRKKRDNKRIKGENVRRLSVGEMRKMGKRIKAMRKTNLLMQIPCTLIRAENASCFAPCRAFPSNFLPLITVKTKQIKSLRRMDDPTFLLEMGRKTGMEQRKKCQLT